MCKLFAVSDASKMDITVAKRLLTHVALDFRLSQKDGFGYAARWARGLIRERFVNPSDFVAPGVFDAQMVNLGWLAGHVEALGCRTEGPTFGSVPLTGPIIAHGRTATNDVRLANTHPLVKQKWALAHNGVVEFDDLLLREYPKLTSCDSEHLLNLNVFSNGPRSFAEEGLSGWYATVAIDPKGRLRVCRDARTDLHVSWCTQWETFLFSTKADLLRSIATAFNVTLTQPVLLLPYTELVMKGNRRVRAYDFDPTDSTVSYGNQTELMQRSLGTPANVTPTSAVTTTPVGPSAPTTPAAASTTRSLGEALKEAHETGVIPMDLEDMLPDFMHENKADPDAIDEEEWRRKAEREAANL